MRLTEEQWDKIRKDIEKNIKRQRPLSAIELYDRLMELENIIDGIILSKLHSECVGRYDPNNKYCLRNFQRGDTDCALCKKMYNYIKKYNINKFLF